MLTPLYKKTTKLDSEELPRIKRKEDQEDRNQIEESPLYPWDKVKEQYAIGSKHVATVSHVAPSCVIVELEKKVTGLIKIQDLSWIKISNPKDIVQKGESIEVIVLEINIEKKVIILGHKQLVPSPWESLDKNLKVGDLVKGKVVQIAKYGAFVQIIPGVVGLIHISEMSWSKLHSAKEIFLKVGDEVEAVIVAIDYDQHRMSLSLKLLKEDPWSHVHEKYPIGCIHKAVVRGFAPFGIFVELEEGVCGLIHISELTWIHNGIIPSHFTEIGSDIDVVVLDINEEKRSLNLGHKQLSENPWDSFETLYTPGSIHIGKIIRLSRKRAIIALNGIEVGYASPKQLVKEDGTMAQLGEDLEFIVICLDREKERIVLSHKQTYDDSNSNHIDSSFEKQQEWKQ